VLLFFLPFAKLAQISDHGPWPEGLMRLAAFIRKLDRRDRTE
jgi:hypothetical protein